MTQERFGGQREAPTQSEIEFCDALESLTSPPYFDYWLHSRSDDQSPWMLVSLTLVDEQKNLVLKTLRLDFDGGSIKGGWSPSDLNWDADVPALEAEIDLTEPDGIDKTGENPKELARLAAAWFLRHYESNL